MELFKSGGCQESRRHPIVEEKVMIRATQSTVIEGLLSIMFFGTTCGDRDSSRIVGLAAVEKCSKPSFNAAR